jgi:hypothetical protein
MLRLCFVLFAGFVFLAVLCIGVLLFVLCCQRFIMCGGRWWFYDGMVGERRV